MCLGFVFRRPETEIYRVSGRVGALPESVHFFGFLRATAVMAMMDVIPTAAVA